MKPALLLVLLLVVPATPSTAAADVVFGLQASASFDEPSIAYGAQLGYRVGRFGVALRVEHGPWMRFDTSEGFFAGTVNVAAGGELLSLGARAITALYAGTATLLAETALDDAGQTGLFLDVRPLGLRLPLGRSGPVLRVDPLHIAMVAPALGKIPLVQVQYRTTVALEWSL